MVGFSIYKSPRFRFGQISRKGARCQFSPIENRLDNAPQQPSELVILCGAGYDFPMQSMPHPLDLLLVQVPNLPETAYLVGVASLKAFLGSRGHHVLCYNPLSECLKNQPNLQNVALTKQFSNACENQPLDIPQINLAVESLRKKIQLCEPRFIGFSLIHGNIRNSLHLAKEMKASFPHIPILIGGPGLKVLYQEIKLQEYVDFLIQDEAENPLHELLLGEKSWSEIPGLEFRNPFWKKNPSDETKPTEYLQPDYSDFFQDPCVGNLFHSIPLTLGRGCPFRCRFCAVKNYGLEYRYYNLDSCMEFVRKSVRAGNKNFFVHDPITNGNPGWLREFCQKLIQEKLEINWGGSIRLTKYLYDTNSLDLLFASGFRTMITGLESASPNVLMHMRKFADLPTIEKIFEKFRAAKKQYPLRVCVQLIVGYPTETEEDFRTTLSFVEKFSDVIDEIISCSSFLMIRAENDDLDEMIQSGAYGIQLISDSNWASYESTPAIRLSRMQRAETLFQRLQLKHRMFYMDALREISEESAAKPLKSQLPGTSIPAWIETPTAML